jgi:nicotinamide mononucleotide adenylyltransferase
MESLPSKTVVFAFGRFNPPTTGHQLLVQFVKKLATKNRADHIIYASRSHDAKKNPLPVDRKVHYLGLMFTGIKFVAANDQIRTFIEAAKELNKKYKNIIMVAGSDRVAEYDRILNKYNGDLFNFDSIKVVSAGERDPDADDASGMSGTKMRALATKGDFDTFKKGLPSTLRDIDARRLMNDVREGMGLDAIKEQVKIPFNALREKYFKGEIYHIGSIVESINGEKFEVVKRGTNHLLVKDSEGNVSSKWLSEVVQ